MLTEAGQRIIVVWPCVCRDHHDAMGVLMWRGWRISYCYNSTGMCKKGMEKLSTTSMYTWKFTSNYQGNDLKTQNIFIVSDASCLVVVGTAPKSCSASSGLRINHILYHILVIIIILCLICHFFRRFRTRKKKKTHDNSMVFKHDQLENTSVL